MEINYGIAPWRAINSHIWDNANDCKYLCEMNSTKFDDTYPVLKPGKPNSSQYTQFLFNDNDN